MSLCRNLTNLEILFFYFGTIKLFSDRVGNVVYSGTEY